MVAWVRKNQRSVHLSQYGTSGDDHFLQINIFFLMNIFTAYTCKCLDQVVISTSPVLWHTRNHVQVTTVIGTEQPGHQDETSWNYFQQGWWRFSGLQRSFLFNSGFLSFFGGITLQGIVLGLVGMEPERSWILNLSGTNDLFGVMWCDFLYICKPRDTSLRPS